ncbi:unnamed protein product [Angiostrongylus costaricensis]|uniref:MFS domain-containing protein n=1 Tax=Angiostrongylus costaricensis TaxID=334426 RepID=A0A0R3PBK4_ANGCS|nr:unnamed protein product [Angiostrongylus costaricensis]
MDAVVEVVERYRHELEDAMQTIRQSGEEYGQSAQQMIQETRNQVEPQTQELITAVRDTSSVPPTTKPVVEVFAWATLMIFFANAGIIVGSYILGPLLSAFLGKSGAALLAFLAIPGYAHYSITKVGYVSALSDILNSGGGDDAAIRFQVLSLAIVQGVLMGFVINSLYLSSIPFAVLTPAITALSFPAVALSANGNRVALLAGTIGAAIIFNFAVGLVTVNLSFTYFLLSLTYGGIAAAVMQLIFKNLHEEAKGHVYQNALSCGFIIAKGTFFLLFGSYEQEGLVHLLLAGGVPYNQTQLKF